MNCFSKYIFLLLLLLNMCLFASYNGTGKLYIGYGVSISELLPLAVYQDYDSLSIVGENVVLVDETLYGLYGGTDSLYFYNEANGLIAQMNVSIHKYIPLQYLRISQGAVEIYVTDTIRLSMYSVPANASIFDTIWTTINESVARIGERGELIGVSEGTTTIELLCTPSMKTSSISVRVKNCNINPPYVYDTLNICNGDSTLFISNSNDVVWYSDEALTIQKHKGAIFQPQYKGAGTYIYFAVKEDGSCKSTAAKAVLNVWEMPETPDFSLYPSEYDLDYIDTVDFASDHNWYKTADMMTYDYVGSGLPDNLTDGSFLYYITKGSWCESDPYIYSFKIFDYNTSDSVRISGSFIDTRGDFEGIVKLISYPEMTEHARNYFYGNDFDIYCRQQGNYLLKIIPINEDGYATVYYGNTTSKEKAYILPVKNYNIGGLEIDMTKTTDIKQLIADNVEIKINNGILIIESQFINSTPYTIYTIYGQEVKRGVLAQGTNSIVVKNLSTGVYYFKMLDFSYTLIVD